MGVVESRKFVAKSFKIFNNTEVPAAFQVNLSQVISFFFFQCPGQTGYLSLMDYY